MYTRSVDTARVQHRHSTGTARDRPTCDFEKTILRDRHTARTLLEETVSNTKAAFEIKSPDQLLTFQKSLALPAIEKAVAYSKSVYAVAVEANTGLSKFAETKASELNQNFVSLLDEASKNAPAGSDVGVAIKSQQGRA